MNNDPGGGILLVDDDGGFRSFVSELLESIGYATTQLASGADVLPTVGDERPAAILLDVQLPGLNGYEVCRELRNRYGDSIAIIFISGERTEALDRAGGLLIGADDYLTKPVDPAELIARVTRLVDRPRSIVNGAKSNDKLESLTRRENEVLELLAEGLNQDEIADRLVISPKTVATHIQRILGKLEVRSRAQAVSIALREERDVTAHVGAETFDVLALADAAANRGRQLPPVAIEATTNTIHSSSPSTPLRNSSSGARVATLRKRPDGQKPDSKNLPDHR